MSPEKIEARYGPVVGRVNSRSCPQKVYEVRRRPDGVLSCNCKAWIFNREQPKHCLHTDAVMVSTGGTDTVKEYGFDQRRLVVDQRRKAALLKRAGIGRPKDAVVIIIEKILVVGGLSSTPGAIARMAGALRPYLQIGKVALAASAAGSERTIMDQGTRLITLDD